MTRCLHILNIAAALLVGRALVESGGSLLVGLLYLTAAFVAAYLLSGVERKQSHETPRDERQRRPVHSHQP